MNEQRLQPLLALAQQRVDTAAGAVQRRRHESVNEQARLTELRGYLAEYETQEGQASRWQLANHSAFMTRLRQAIGQQSQTVERAEQAVDDAVQQWSAQRLDQRRFELLQTQARDAQQAARAHHEQGELDELASRAQRLFR
ncbi:MAG TPA: flagellar export protein FliJ [Burkholderiaceae bacterium]